MAGEGSVNETQKSKMQSDLNSETKGTSMKVLKMGKARLGNFWREKRKKLRFQGRQRSTEDGAG